MDSVFKKALQLEKTFHRMSDSTILITWKVPNPYASTSQPNLANEQNRHEATNKLPINLIRPKSSYEIFNRNRKYSGSALQRLSNKNSQYEIREHRTMNMIFLQPNVIDGRYI